MESYININDRVLGELNGRDCIFIDKVTFEDVAGLTFEGEISGWLASKIREEKWIPYKLMFKGVISHFVCELDTYESLMGFVGCSDFAIIENSEMMSKIPIRSDYDKSRYKHFRVFTYDYVFDILAESYELAADLDKAKPIGNGG
ncbi:MAG: hypothetical protein K2N06_03710 [Oscillospiraceae bacterium]|nr:hypothetical protein [Oscillospiraceae bacterium]